MFLAAAKAHSQGVRALFADVLTRQQLAALANAMDTLAGHLTVPGAGIGSQDA